MCNSVVNEAWRELLGKTQPGVVVVVLVGASSGWPSRWKGQSWVLPSPTAPKRISVCLNQHRRWRSKWRAALPLRRQRTDTHTHKYLSPLISCFQHLSIFLALWLPHPLPFPEWDLWSKISAPIMPFSVDWQTIVCPLGSSLNGCRSIPELSAITQTWAYACRHCTQTRKVFTCKACIKAHLSMLACAGTRPWCVRHSRRGHSGDSSQLREAAWLEGDGAEEFCSQIPLAPPDELAEWLNKATGWRNNHEVCVWGVGVGRLGFTGLTFVGEFVCGHLWVTPYYCSGASCGHGVATLAESVQWKLKV